jgi:HD-GYP domain-containing protein (c-di-GMP phosphodiesterase class II)
MTTMTEAPPKQAAEDGSAPKAGSSSSQPRRNNGILVALGVNEAAMQRARDTSGFEVSNDPNELGAARIVAISTRAERGRSPRIPPSVDPESTPVVVICHPGGEETAVELMKMGCAGVVAEGNERALGSFVDPEQHTDVLVEGFLEQQEKTRSGGSSRRRDPVTNLPEVASFEMRLGEFIEAGTPPNVVMMQITNLDQARERTDSRAINLLRRRLASFYHDAAQRYSCEVFSLGQSTFAVLDGKQLLASPERFAQELIEITEAFRPAGVKLKLAVGAVIASAESEVMAIRDQAEQAVVAAAQADESAYVTADQVTILLASATEYAVAQLLVGMVDSLVPGPPGHSNRVAELVSDMAREMGFQGRDLNNLRLAALLHEIGRIPLGDNEPAPEETFPERGARYVLPSAGPEIADAIRYQAERWDGAGPATLIEDDIPLSARILAIAEATDALLHPPAGQDAVGPTELIERLKAEAGSRFDPNLIETVIRLFGGM